LRNIRKEEREEGRERRGKRGWGRRRK